MIAASLLLKRCALGGGAIPLNSITPPTNSFNPTSGRKSRGYLCTILECTRRCDGTAAVVVAIPLAFVKLVEIIADVDIADELNIFGTYENTLNIPTSVLNIC